MHGFVAANSAIMLILCLVGGEVREAYAETEFGGITDGKVVDADVELGKGNEIFGEDDSWLTADFFGVMLPF